MKAGQAACASDDVDGCSDAYSTALSLVPKELAPHLNMFKHRIELELGAACYRAKRLREAMEHLRSSAALGEPGSGSTLRAMYTLGQALEAHAHVTGGGWLHNDDATRAIEAYEAVVASDGFARADDLSLRADCLTNLGIMHGRRDSLKESARYLRRAVALEPDHHIATQHLIETLLWDGDEDGADALARGAVQRGMWERPDQTPAHYLHGVATTPWPDVGLYPEVAAAVASLEASYDAIRAECAAMLRRSGLDGLRFGQMEGLDGRGGGWHARKLDCASGAERSAAPQTCSAVQRARRETSVFTSQFLRLEPGAVIRPHCGEGNHRWVVHLGLDGLDGASITVAGERRGWERGRCLVFDDSYRHQVTHTGKADRLVFALQIENPEYARREREVRYQ